MANPLSLRKSRFDSDSLTATESSAFASSKSADFPGALTALNVQLQDKSCTRDVLLRQIANDAQYFTAADSAVVALGQPGRIVCLARSGSIGPALGAALDSRSGISGECIRQKSALRCEDSEKDPRVDAQVCRILGIRSLAVVPVFENGVAVGVLEVFSSQPNAFGDHHVSALEKLAELTSRVPGGATSAHPGSVASAQKHKEQSPTPHFGAHDSRSQRWLEAFQLRPYQIAIVAGFVLLDLVTIYWQLR